MDSDKAFGKLDPTTRLFLTLNTIMVVLEIAFIVVLLFLSLDGGTGDETCLESVSTSGTRFQLTETGECVPLSDGS